MGSQASKVFLPKKKNQYNTQTVQMRRLISIFTVRNTKLYCMQDIGSKFCKVQLESHSAMLDLVTVFRRVGALFSSRLKSFNFVSLR